MERYLSGNQAVVTVQLVDDAGATIDATAASYRVLDQDGNVLVDTTAVSGFNSGAANAVVTVPSGDNTLATDVKRSMRVIELTLTTAASTVLLEHAYIVERPDSLTVPQESFQTLSQAEFRAVDMLDLDGWNTATRARKIAALMQARRDLSGMTFRQSFPDDQVRILDFLPIGVMDYLTAAEFNSLFADFREALCKAQVYQADHLLGGDPIAVKREQGITSETIGESSMFLKPASRTPICERALRVVARYLERRVKVGRA